MLIYQGVTKNHNIIMEVSWNGGTPIANSWIIILIMEHPSING